LGFFIIFLVDFLLMKNSLLVRWSIVVSLAGFIFGFDTVVISGANQPIK
jgi:hypothetical protein